MTPPRRPRTGIRRDGGVQRINSNEVRYPGAKLPDLPNNLGDQPDGRRLRPARDTGLAVEGRLARERRRRTRLARTRAIAFAVVVVVLGIAALGWRQASDRRAKSEPLPGTVTAASASGRVEGDVMHASAPRQPEPTPFFASLGSVKMRVPVPVEKLTEIGFHQASYTYALHLKTSLPDADMTRAKSQKGTGRDLSTQQVGADAALTGQVLRMWRSRPGKPDSAVDVGAAPGTDVFAPVTGTIIKIKRYKLYGKYDDYEIHIQPDGHAEIDCVMIHIEDLSCEIGDEVVAGVTRIAAVRKLSDRVHHQLGDYSKGGGDHVHVQLNDATDPQYKGLKGAISVDGS